MRDIIFRGKRLDNGEWETGSLIISMVCGIKQYHIQREGTAGYLYCFAVNPATVGQYTGLKDKKGRMIFEGDILRSENGYAEPIGWSQDNAGFATMDFANGEYIYEIDQFLASTKTISGTIHDNPDLLK